MTANLTGATVRIGGLRYGGTPVEPRSIKPGTLEIDLDKQGYKPAHLTVEALPGIVTDVAVELEAAEAKPAAPSPPPGAPPPGRPAPTTPSPAKPPPAKPSPAQPSPAQLSFP